MRSIGLWETLGNTFSHHQHQPDQHEDEGAKRLLLAANTTRHSRPLPSRSQVEGSGVDVTVQVPALLAL